MFKALQSDSITLYLINEDNLAEVYARFQGYPDSAEMMEEIPAQIRKRPAHQLRLLLHARR